MAVCRAHSIQMDSMKSLHPATDFSTAHCIDRCNVKTGERISKTVPKTNFSVTSSSRFQRFYVSDEPVPSSYMWREGKLSTIFKDITDAVAKGIDFPHSGRLVVCPLEEVTSRTGWETSSSTDEDVQSSTLNCKKLEHLEVLWGADWFAFFTYILCAYKNSICQRLQKDGNKHLESKLLEVTNVINGLLEAGGCDTTGSDLPTSNFGEWVAKQELFGDKDATVHAVIDYGVHNGASSTLTKRCCENNITHHLTNRLVAFSDGGQESVRDKFAQCVLDEADYECIVTFCNYYFYFYCFLFPHRNSQKSLQSHSCSMGIGSTRWSWHNCSIARWPQWDHASVCAHAVLLQLYTSLVLTIRVL